MPIQKITSVADTRAYGVDVKPTSTWYQSLTRTVHVQYNKPWNKLKNSYAAG